MTNKHGYKMVGLKKAVSEMPGENYGGQYVQISYDKNDGQVLANYHVSLGCNSWSEYHDSNIITIGKYQQATMQQLADDIAERIAEDAERKEEMEALEANMKASEASRRY